MSISDDFLVEMQALMPKDVIISQLVHMLSSEEVKRSGANALSMFAQYGKLELAWKPFHILMVIQRTCEL